MKKLIAIGVILFLSGCESIGISGNDSDAVTQDATPNIDSNGDGIADILDESSGIDGLKHETQPTGYYLNIGQTCVVALMLFAYRFIWADTQICPYGSFDQLLGQFKH